MENTDDVVKAKRSNVSTDEEIREDDVKGGKCSDL